MSPRACQGILNRASSRGKKLPSLLEKALRAQAQREREREQRTLRNERYEQYDEDDRSVTLCAHGGVYGGGSQTLCVEYDGIGINGDIAGCIDAHYYLGCGNRGGVEREVVAQKVRL